MPNKQFLEEYTLYRKFSLDQTEIRDPLIAEPAINMYCETCGSQQTFNMQQRFELNSVPIIAYQVAGTKQYQLPENYFDVARYRCAHCGTFERFFYLRFSENLTRVEKVGQFPPWSIEMEKELAKALRDSAELYKKALILESQGYGVGAFAYYRRVVESLINVLLDGILDLLDDKEKEEYEKALKQIKSSHSAQDRLDLVKDLLPSRLKPEGQNPLSILYDAISEGLHAKTDEECLENAGKVRVSLNYLLITVSRTDRDDKNFTEGMRAILSRKVKPKPGN